MFIYSFDKKKKKKSEGLLIWKGHQALGKPP